MAIVSQVMELLQGLLSEPWTRWRKKPDASSEYASSWARRCCPQWY